MTAFTGLACEFRFDFFKAEKMLDLRETPSSSETLISLCLKAGALRAGNVIFNNERPGLFLDSFCLIRDYGDFSCCKIVPILGESLIRLDGKVVILLKYK
jgi:hypothetical protein